MVETISWIPVGERGYEVDLFLQISERTCTKQRYLHWDIACDLCFMTTSLTFLHCSVVVA